MISDLDGYIDRKAQEIAGEKVGEAIHDLLVKVSAAQADAAAERQRREDLCVELRRVGEARERMVRRAEEGLAAALGMAGHCSLNLGGLVTEVETALASRKD
jgi:predicted deacylase